MASTFESNFVCQRRKVNDNRKKAMRILSGVRHYLTIVAAFVVLARSSELVESFTSLPLYRNSLVQHKTATLFPVVVAKGQSREMTIAPKSTGRNVRIYQQLEKGDDEEMDQALSKVKEGDSSANNFDAEGFGGYLAQYALAVVASVLVTGAFVKLVLLDY